MVASYTALHPINLPTKVHGEDVGGISGSLTVFPSSFAGPLLLPFPFCDIDELGNLDGTSEGD